MKKIVTLLVALVLLMLSSIANAANIKDFPRVAVMQFGNKAITTQGLQTGDFTLCSEYAIYQLLNSGWFDLVDYEQLSNIAKMHSINMSGLVDQSTAVQLGKFASAQFMVVGNVTGLTLKNSMLGAQAGNLGSVGGNKNTVTANVVMRIVDIETGRIVAAGIGSGSSSSTNAEIKFNLYRKNTSVNTDGYGGSGDNTDNIGSTGSDNYDNYGNLQGENNSGSNEGTDTSQTIPSADSQENLTGTGDLPTNSYPISDSNPTPLYNEYETYSVKIGTFTVSDVQVRNALGKAVRDAVYGRTGLMTTLNGGKPLKIKTGF